MRISGRRNRRRIQPLHCAAFRSSTPCRTGQTSPLTSSRFTPSRLMLMRLARPATRAVWPDFRQKDGLELIHLLRQPLHQRRRPPVRSQKNGRAVAGQRARGEGVDVEDGGGVSARCGFNKQSASHDKNRLGCGARASALGRKHYAASSRNSTLIASNGKTMPPPSARSSTPAFSRAVMSE